MSREKDLQWFLTDREKLSSKFPNLWIVVKDQEIQKVFKSEEEAVDYSVNAYGLDVASVFLATTKDRFIYVGAI